MSEENRNEQQPDILPGDCNLYRRMVEDSRDGISITQDGKFKYVNKAFCEMLGYTSDELLAMPGSDLLAPHDKERVMAQHYRRMAGEVGNQVDFITLIRKNGSYIDIEMSANRIEYDGKLASYISARDITERKRMQEALEKSEQKYRDLADLLPQTVYELDMQGKITFMNQAGINAFGKVLQSKDISAKDFIAAEDHQRLVSNLQSSYQGNKPTSGNEYTALRADGSRYPIIVFGSPVYNNGVQTGTRGIIIDISERKAVENALRESENKYRQLFAAESDAIFVVDADTGEILDTNPAASSIYGFSRDEILAMKNTDVSAEPEKTSEATKQHQGLVPYRLHKKKDGTIFPVELSAGFTTLGNRSIQIVTSRDITERIRIQEALSKSELKYRELTEMLPQAIYELDESGKPTYMNVAGLKMFGIENGINNRKAIDFFIPEDMHRMKQALFKESVNLLFDNDDVKPIPSEPAEFTAMRQDGSTFPVLIYGTSILEKGKVVGSRGLIIDISERKAMENALRESESKYKTLIENSQDGIFAIAGDKILFANNTLCKILGYSSEELYSIQASVLLHPNDRHKGIAISQRRKNGDASTINDIFHFLAKDGTIKETDVFSSVVVLNGQTVSLITVHDITETRRMQEQLQVSEEKYRTVIDKATDGIVITQQGKLKFLNASMCEMLGYDEAEIIDKPFLNFVVKDEQQIMIDFHKRRMDGEDFASLYRSHFIRKNGEIIAVELNARTSVYNGQPAAFIIIRNISERMAMEDALQKSEERFRRMIQSLQEGLFVVQEEKFVFVNEAIVDILGYTVDEMLGRPFMDVIPPEKIEYMVSRHGDRKNGEKGSWSYEYTLLHKDGVTRVPVILSTNLTEVDGKMAVVGTAKDITDRVRSEKELRDAHNRLEEVNHMLEDTITQRTNELTEVNTQLLKAQKENLQSQFDVLKQQVNPHFLFNSLNVLTSLIRLEPELAEKFTEHLSKVYRYVLENKDNELVKLATELDFLDAYIFLLNIRFLGKIAVNINISEEKKNCLVIPLAMQLLIENAIKHNAMSKKSPLVIDIFIDDNRFLNIINNLQEREAHMVSTGVGLKNIQNRYLLLNNSAPEFEKTSTHFIARIPLICETNS